MPTVPIITEPFVVGPVFISALSAIAGAIIAFIMKTIPFYTAFVHRQERMELAMVGIDKLSASVEKLTNEMVTLNTKFQYVEKLLNP